MANYKDLSGLRFNHWTVIERDFDSIRDIRWKCRCDCGAIHSVIGQQLKNGKSKSCKICSIKYRREKHIEKLQTTETLVGKRFGRLIVVDFGGMKTRKSGERCVEEAYWLCKCDCGREMSTSGDRLKRGVAKSCGCLQRDTAAETGKSSMKNIAGNRYGKLIAVEPTAKKISGCTVWYCLCDCGNDCEVTISHLTSGGTGSCGKCGNMSFGEEKIASILKENKIEFIREKKFIGCISPNTGRQLRFDFWVDDKYVIEYDGRQHFSGDNWMFEKTDPLCNRKLRDQVKNEWCAVNNVPIIRIPYTHYHNICIEDLCLDTSPFLLQKGG